MKHIPYRKCIITNTSYPKTDLIRLVLNKQKEVKIDLTHHLEGKGAYLSKVNNAVKILRQKKLLMKVFKLSKDVDENIYKELEKIINA